MTLQKKTLILIGAAGVFQIVFIYVISSLILIRNLKELERQDAVAQVERAYTLLQARLSDLNNTTQDYAWWDDSYYFVKDRNKPYIRLNMQDATFARLRLNLAVFIDTQGKIVYLKLFDGRTVLDTKVPAEIIKYFSTASPLTRHTKKDAGVQGFVRFSRDLMMVSSQALLPSEEDGTIRGTLVFGQWLDAKEIRHLERMLGLSLQVRPLVSSPPPDTDSVSVGTDASFVSPDIKVREARTIKACKALMDFEGRPCARLLVEMPRKIYQQGLLGRRNLILTLMLGGFVFGGVVMILVHKSVLSRLTRLTKDIGKISREKDLSRRVKIFQGTDELCELARRLNEMLDALEQKDIDLGKNKRRYESVVNQVLEGITLFDPETWQPVEVNPAFLEITGLGPEDIPSLHLEEIVGQPREAFRQDLQQVFETKSSLIGEAQIRRKDGRRVRIEYLINYISLERSGLICFVIRDITERKRIQKKLARYRQNLQALASRLVLTEEQERRRIATELHDNIGQILAVSKIHLGQVREEVHSPAIKENLDGIYDFLSQAIQYTRSLTFELSPPILYQLGFEAAVEWLAGQIRKQHGLTITFRNDTAVKPLNNNMRVVLFQSVRELLFNVVKHAGAGQVKVTIVRRDKWIEVAVEDNGGGFDPGKVFPFKGKKKIRLGTGGFGLFNIRERLNQMGGRMEINSGLGKGTCITLTARLETEEMAGATGPEGK